MRRVVNDWPLILVALLLSCYGVAMVYSAGQTDVPTAATHAWMAQIRWVLLSIGLAYAVSRASVRFFEWAALPIYILTCLLLLSLLKFGGGAGDAASSKSWLVIAGP